MGCGSDLSDIAEVDCAAMCGPPALSPVSKVLPVPSPSGMSLDVDCNAANTDGAPAVPWNMALDLAVSEGFSSDTLKKLKMKMEAQHAEQGSQLESLWKTTDKLSGELEALQDQMQLVAEVLQAQMDEASVEQKLAASQADAQLELREALEDERLCCQRRLHTMAEELREALQISYRNHTDRMRNLQGAESDGIPFQLGDLVDEKHCRSQSVTPTASQSV